MVLSKVKHILWDFLAVFKQTKNLKTTVNMELWIYKIFLKKGASKVTHQLRIRLRISYLCTAQITVKSIVVFACNIFTKHELQKPVRTGMWRFECLFFPFSHTIVLFITKIHLLSHLMTLKLPSFNSTTPADSPWFH